MRTLALVDGEHYPPVTRDALAAAGERGHEIVAAILVGGTEKLAAGGEPPDLGVPEIVVARQEPMHVLRSAIERFKTHSGDVHPSPLFGAMTKETALQLQLKHAAHHLSFLVPKST